MPLFKDAPRSDDLSERERPLFVAWVGSRPFFRAGPGPGYLEEIGGWVLFHQRPLSLAELVERWRSLGCPTPMPRIRRSPPPGYRPQRRTLRRAAGDF